MFYFTTFSAACKLRCCFPSPITVRFRKKPADTKIGKMWLWSKVFLFVNLFGYVEGWISDYPNPACEGWSCILLNTWIVCMADGARWSGGSAQFVHDSHALFFCSEHCMFFAWITQHFSINNNVRKNKKKHFPLWPPVLCSCHCFCNQLLWFYVLDAMYNASWETRHEYRSEGGPNDDMRSTQKHAWSETK